MTQDEAFKLLDETSLKLGEHFDSIQILATYTEQSSSYSFMAGAGNFYARLELARSFIRKDEMKDFIDLLKRNEL